MNIPKPTSSLPLRTVQQNNLALGALIARAEDGDAGALKQLSEATRMSAGELRDALRNGGEAAVWDRAAAGFAALGQDASPIISANKQAAAGDTVRHLGGFRDVSTMKDKAAALKDAITSSGPVSTEEALQLMNKVIDDHEIKPSELSQIVALLERTATPGSSAASTAMLSAFATVAKERFAREESRHSLLDKAIDGVFSLFGVETSTVVSPSNLEGIMRGAIVPLVDAPATEASAEDRATYAAIRTALGEGTTSIEAAAVDAGTIANSAYRAMAFIDIAGAVMSNSDTAAFAVAIDRQLPTQRLRHEALVALAANEQVPTPSLLHAMRGKEGLGSLPAHEKRAFFADLHTTLLEALELRKDEPGVLERFAGMYKHLGLDGFDRHRLALLDTLFDLGASAETVLAPALEFARPPLFAYGEKMHLVDKVLNSDRLTPDDATYLAGLVMMFGGGASPLERMTRDADYLVRFSDLGASVDSVLKALGFLGKTGFPPEADQAVYASVLTALAGRTDVSPSDIAKVLTRALATPDFTVIPEQRMKVFSAAVDAGVLDDNALKGFAEFFRDDMREAALQKIGARKA